MEAARIGEIGDGKISMASIEEAIGIRTCEKEEKHYRYHRLQRRFSETHARQPGKTYNYFLHAAIMVMQSPKPFTVYTIAQIL